MKPGDLVRFVRRKVNDPKSSLGMYLREDAIGIIVRRVRHVDNMWIVNFPKLGGTDGYLESWLEVIDEN